MHFGRLTNLYLQTFLGTGGQVGLPDGSLTAQYPLGDTQHGFDWDDVPASKHFDWHTCFSDFKCARLQVPMDWHSNTTEADKTVEIAVIKVEATVPVTDPTYGGPVVLNPGGPGGSGVNQVLNLGHLIRTLLSAGEGHTQATAKHFDIIGFDPRGINNTRPLFTCFPTHLEAAAWDIEQAAIGYIGSSDQSFDYMWAANRALADGCSKRTAEEGIAKHVSTAAVARDIIEIVEQHGRWRAQEAERLLGLAPRTMADEKTVALKRTKYRPGDETVQYWGFSYGTILGATLVAMFPERIHRAILDGVADSFDYMAGGWRTNLQDTDTSFVKFAEYCFEGGAANCAVHDPDGPQAITAKIQETINSLRHNPIPVPGNATNGPSFVTLNDLNRLIRDIVYKPLYEFPFTASVLHELSQRNGTALAAWKRAQQPDLSEILTSKCHRDGPFSAACHKLKFSSLSREATSAIACSDADPKSHVGQSKGDYLAYANELISQSSLIGASWAEIMIPCTAWTARAAWRYGGNFTSSPRHPILLVGNSVDPVTPLRNAYHMAQGFEGSGVLHQNSEGHCSLASISLCSARAIREYFQTGELPGRPGDNEGWSGPGKYCEPDRKPFDGYTKHSKVPLPEGETDKALWEALVGLNRGGKE